MDCRGKGVIASLLQSTLGTGKFSQPAAQRWLAGWLGMGYFLNRAGAKTGERVSVRVTVWLAGLAAHPSTSVKPSCQARRRATQINLIIMIMLRSHALLTRPY